VSVLAFLDRIADVVSTKTNAIAFVGGGAGEGSGTRRACEFIAVVIAVFLAVAALACRDDRRLKEGRGES
jgi:hypothetical protein